MFRRPKTIFALIALALTAILVYPTTRDHLRATSLLLRIEDPKTESFLAKLGTHDVQEMPITVGAFRARLYSPIGVARPPGMVIVHGIHHLGIDEPRLVAFARAFASEGVTVLTPEMKDVADYRVTPQSVDVIGVAVHELRARVGHPVGVLGLSFSGGLALMAAADERYKPDIAFVVHRRSLHVLRVDGIDEKAKATLAMVDNPFQRRKLAFHSARLDGLPILQRVLQAAVTVVFEVLWLEIDDRVGAQRPFVSQELLQAKRLSDA